MEGKTWLKLSKEKLVSNRSFSEKVLQIDKGSGVAKMGGG